MSNQLGMSKIQAILGLRRQGWSFVRIAAELGLHRETVSRYVHEHERQSAGFDSAKPTEVHTGSADSKPSQVHTGSSEVTRSGCEPYRRTIVAMLEQGLSAVRIHQDLSSDHGYRGSYYSVMRFVRRLEVEHELPYRRLEVEPAEEAQVDFGTGIPIITPEGRKRKTHVLRIVLSYSRKAYSEVIYRQTTENFIRCLENAFWEFGGVPRTLVIDNLRAAVTKANWYEPEFNRKLAEFCEYYNVVILPTKVRTPRHKGKIEAGVKYVKRNALQGRTFHSLQEQNDRLADWEKTIADKRIHGTTKRQVDLVFQEEERSKLQKLPSERFPVFHEGERSVHRDGHVEVDKSYYSVPPEYLGRRVWARWDSRLVRIFNHRLEQIAVHIKQQPGKFSTLREHVHPHKIAGIEQGTTYLLRKASLLGADAGHWAQQVIQQRGIEGVRTVMGLIHLTGKHTARSINDACRVANSYSAHYLRNIRKLLEHQQPPQEELAFMDEHPIIRNIEVYGDLVRSSLQKVREKCSLDA